LELFLNRTIVNSDPRKKKAGHGARLCFIFLSIFDDLNASKGPQMHAMSPPLQGLNPTNPISHSRRKRPNCTNKDLPAGLPEQNRNLTELQNEVRRLVSAHLIHRKHDLLYCSASSEVEGLLAEFAGHVARVIGIPGEPSCRHVGHRRDVAAGRGIRQRECHRPLRAGCAGEGPGTARIVLKED
jgi:hypothetical protein